ncbi:MAG: hypothetical protein ACTSYA_01875 [Candidatus Kariarchaeaceae archaeon]
MSMGIQTNLGEISSILKEEVKEGVRSDRNREEKLTELLKNLFSLGTPFDEIHQSLVMGVMQFGDFSFVPEQLLDDLMNNAQQVDKERKNYLLAKRRNKTLKMENHLFALQGVKTFWDRRLMRLIKFSKLSASVQVSIWTALSNSSNDALYSSIGGKVA